MRNWTFFDYKFDILQKFFLASIKHFSHTWRWSVLPNWIVIISTRSLYLKKLYRLNLTKITGQPITHVVFIVKTVCFCLMSLTSREEPLFTLLELFTLVKVE